MARRSAHKRPAVRRPVEGAHATSLASDSPVESLPPTARRILRAARRIVAKGGYGAMSMQAVADEAGELKSTIAYHFGDKAGLTSAVLESVIHDGNVSAIRALESIPPGAESVHELLVHQRAVAQSSEYWRLLFALIPEIVTNKRLRSRFGELMLWYYEIDLRSLGLHGHEEAPEEYELLASLLLAVLEGFALQRELMPDDYDLEARFALWEKIIGPYVAQMQAQVEPGRAPARGPGSRAGGRTPAETEPDTRVDH